MMTESERWLVVFAGQIGALELLAGMGEISAGNLLSESKRLIEHPKGCPDEYRVRLEKLRRQASAQLT